MSLAFTIASELRDAVMAELATRNLETPQRVGVVHGTPVFDECCEGMLWSRWVSQFLTNAFPAPSEGPAHCSTLTPAASFEVGLLRCVPAPITIGQNSVRLPSAEDLEISALELANDAAALLAGVYCAAGAWGRGRRYLIGSLESAETAGGCGGSVLGLTVELSGLMG